MFGPRLDAMYIWHKSKIYNVYNIIYYNCKKQFHSILNFDNYESIKTNN